MAIGFAAFSCHIAIRRKKKMQIFVKKWPKSQNSCSLCQKLNFQREFAAREFSMMYPTGKQCKSLEILTDAVLSLVQNFAFSKVFENRLNHQIVRKMW